jgi:hypothetical protein
LSSVTPARVLAKASRRPPEPTPSSSRPSGSACDATSRWMTAGDRSSSGITPTPSAMVVVLAAATASAFKPE